MTILKAAKETQIAKLAQAIAHDLRTESHTAVRAIGKDAGAVMLCAIAAAEALLEKPVHAIPRYIEAETERGKTKMLECELKK